MHAVEKLSRPCMLIGQPSRYDVAYRAIENEDMKRRSEVHEMAEKTSEGHGNNLSWG